MNTIDSSGSPHTSEYLEELAILLTKKIELEFGCHKRSIVADIAANVSKTSHNIEFRSDVDVVTYGCSAYLMNLVAHDLKIDNVKDHILQIVKYFRNQCSRIQKNWLTKTCITSRYSLEYHV